MSEEEFIRLRVEHIEKSGQFGCDGRHQGNGSPDCPRVLHHHHDMFCRPPTPYEWALAGKTGEIVWGSRA